MAKKIRGGRLAGWLCLVWALCGAGCGQAPPTPEAATPTAAPSRLPQEWEGSGAEILSLEGWEGPAIARVEAQDGPLAMRVTLTSGLNRVTLLDAMVKEEYRGLTLAEGGSSSLDVQAEGAWRVTLYPPEEAYFDRLNVPGIYSGMGGGVILLRGEYGIAIFDTKDAPEFTAWAFGPGGVGEQLSIRPDGDYQGRSVLPRGAGWLVISTPGAWRVEVQEPCCEKPAGY